MIQQTERLDPISAFIKVNLPAGISVDDFYIGITFLIIAISIVLIDNMLGNRKNRLMARIKAIHARRKELYKQEMSPKKRKKPESSINFMRKVSMKFELVKKFQLEQAEATLVQAGFRTKDALLIFAFITLVLPFILGPLGVILMELSTPVTFTGKLLGWLWPLLGLYFGLKLPWIFIRRKKAKRYLAIQRALSDTLDLMTVCAEAGLSITASMDRVARELGTAYPEMAEELTLTSVEINFYPERNKALTNFAERCDMKEIRGIVTVLIQTEKYGTPIAQALRVLSAEFRQTRMMRAENKAARLPALMTLPMILFILPTVFIIIMAPAVINAKKNLYGSEFSK
ncbi:MAG: type II secretion system F family protein [Rickettsiales bacterium]